MPRPLPDYVPEAIRAVLESKGWGLTRWASAVGVHPTVVMKTFSGAKSNRSLSEFEEFCHAVGRSLSDVEEILRKPERQRRTELKSLIYERYDSIQALCGHLPGVSDGYIEQLFRGETGAAVTDIYSPMGNRIGMTLDQFAPFVPRGVE